MEKINAEELKNLLGAHALSDDELENVTGGAVDCQWVHDKFFLCQDGDNDFDFCMQTRCADLASCGAHDAVCGL